MSEFYDPEEWVSITIHKPAFTKLPARYEWTISNGNHARLIAKGKAFTTRGALRGVQKAHAKIERDTLKLEGRVKYQMFLSS